QMLGSANISGSPAMHFMTGNLSFQIEHHLYPDLPSNRYQEIAPKVQEVFERYGLTYTSGSLPRQVASAWAKIIRLSLPNAPVSDIESPTSTDRRCEPVQSRTG
ncbi:MAG: fatty acid desaturase, partial [Mycobacterium sp.]|nr:fatty acid desaturase [Mycobacterium sp.]